MCFASICFFRVQAEITSDQISALLTATNNEVEGYYPIIMASFLSNPEKVAELITTPGGSGGGGGGGGSGAGAGDGAEEAVEEEKAEEEEIGDAPVVDMFGGGDGGGDY